VEYKDILKRVNNQKNSPEINNKLFWYLGLIQAIELFSQKLNFDQVVYTCMDSINELLLVEKSAIYVKQEDTYVLKRQKGFESCVNEISNSQILRDLPVLNAGLLNKDKGSRYFGGSLIDEMEVQMVVPLIMENELFGFILIGNKIIGEYDEDNFVLAEALMRLFNNALENYKKYEDIQKINRELDEKVFNLFAINQSSKVLLSELNISNLYTLAVDVFSELTQSSVTGFILLDKPSNSFVLRSYRNIFDVNQKMEMVVRNKQNVQVDPYRIILSADNKNDVEYLKNISADWQEMIEKLKTKYFILLIKRQEIIGIVTIGESITGQGYKDSVFELIESLATSTYIAISNAELFKKVNEQKELINRKLEKLIMLNSLMKNINSSKSLNVMVQMVLKTLDVAFRVEKALIAVYDDKKNQFNILDTLGFDTKKRKIVPTKDWKRAFEGDMIYETGIDIAGKYVKKELAEDMGSISGIVISPISLETAESIETFGVVIVFKYKEALITDEENRVIVQTISNHIATIMSSFSKMEEQARTLIPNYIECFKDDLKEAIDESERFNLDIEVINVQLKDRFTFKENAYLDDIIKTYKKVYPVSNSNIFIITYIKNDNIENELKEKIGSDIEIEKHRLNRDFKSFEEFIKLY
jgi:hypothetical protein